MRDESFCILLKGESFIVVANVICTTAIDKIGYSVDVDPPFWWKLTHLMGQR